MNYCPTKIDYRVYLYSVHTTVHSKNSIQSADDIEWSISCCVVFYPWQRYNRWSPEAWRHWIKCTVLDHILRRDHLASRSMGSRLPKALCWRRSSRSQRNPIPLIESACWCDCRPARRWWPMCRALATICKSTIWFCAVWGDARIWPVSRLNVCAACMTCHMLLRNNSRVKDRFIVPF